MWAAGPAPVDARDMRACLLAAVLLAGCIEQPSTSHISKPVIGGEITPEGEFPCVGALWLSSQNTFECTGTLIAPDVVLTAAHCIVFAGETPDFTFAHDTVSTLPPVLQVSSAIAHENFDINTDPGSGPGVWYDKDSGRIHARLAHTHLPAPIPNYRGETDPRRSTFATRYPASTSSGTRNR